MATWDESADFRVIGSGGGSMCARRLVQRHFGKSVLVLEGGKDRRLDGHVLACSSSPKYMSYLTY